jgi:hypothetical protein
MSAEAVRARRKPSLVLALVRIVVFTAAFAVLGFALGGLMGIVAIAVINLAGERTDMVMALFAGALPGAGIGLAVGFIVMVRSEMKAIEQG